MDAGDIDDHDMVSAASDSKDSEDGDSKKGDSSTVSVDDISNDSKSAEASDDKKANITDNDIGAVDSEASDNKQADAITDGIGAVDPDIDIDTQPSTDSVTNKINENVEVSYAKEGYIIVNEIVAASPILDLGTVSSNHGSNESKESVDDSGTGSTIENDEEEIIADDDDVEGAPAPVISPGSDDADNVN